MIQHCEFMVTREVDATRSLVFDAWTKLEHLKEWMLPMGLPLTAANIDLSVGGMYHYGLRGTDGRDIWGKWVFREIATPRKIVFVVSFSDSQGDTSRHPFSPAWPLEELATVDLTESHCQTSMRFSLSPLNGQRIEIQAFKDGHDALELVWGEMFDRLQAYLATLSGSRV